MATARKRRSSQKLSGFNNGELQTITEEM